MRSMRQFSVWLAAALLLACSSARQGDGGSERDLGDVVISLKRGLCFGECPVYRLTVFGDGRVEYFGERFVLVEGSQEARIPVEKVTELVDLAYKIGYFDLQNEYRDDMVADASSATTSVSIGGKTKTIYHYYGDFDAPKELYEFEKKIDEVTDSQQWWKRPEWD